MTDNDMTDSTLINQLANEIRDIYSLDSDRAEERIGKLLKKKLESLSGHQSLSILTKLLDEFGCSSKSNTADPILDDSIIQGIYLRLLGKDVSRSNLSSAELLERLKESLDTIFDSLDQLVYAIENNLLGEDSGSGFRTITAFNPESLEDSLGQIYRAFSISKHAFERTARVKVGQILQTLAPDQIGASENGWLKIGPLQKAKCYEKFEESYYKIRRWFESDLFLEDFRQEFEKNCQILSGDTKI